MKTFLSYLSTALLALGAAGDFQFTKENAGSPKYSAVLLTPVNGRVLYWNGTTLGNLDIAGTYQPIITDGSLALAKLATDPLARGSHTGTQSYTTISGLGTLATQSGTFSGTSSGTNTGDQTSIVGITGTKAQFNTALTDGDFVTLAGTETLTNKTFSGGFLDSTNLGGALIVSAGATFAYETPSDATGHLSTLGGTVPTGTGAVVRATSPTLVTPALGTPSSIVLTNATGTATALNIGGTAANATLAAGLSATLAVASGGTGTTTGSITGTTALTFTAGGTNQNITLTPSGSGEASVVTSSGFGYLNVDGAGGSVLRFKKAGVAKGDLSHDGNFLTLNATAGGVRIFVAGTIADYSSTAIALNKNTTVTGTLSVTGASTLTGAVGIGGTANANAQLDVQSTTKAFMPPRMTKTQRDAIASPTAGMVVYQSTDTPGLRTFNGTNWMKYTEATD